MIAVDTNVLVHAVDSGEPGKSARAWALLERLQREPTVLLWRVVCEFGAVIRRKQRTSHIRMDVPSLVSAWMEVYRLALPTRGVLRRGWGLIESHQPSYWDAMLIAACEEAGVDTLHSEDLQSSPVVGNVRLISPFA